MSERLDRGVIRVLRRLATALERLGDADAAAFLGSFGDLPPTPDGCSLDLPSGAPEPIDRLVAGLSPVPQEVEVLLLALATHHHEGVAAVLRSLHVEARPWATVGLAATVLGCRSELRRVLADGALVRSGALLVEGDGPWPERTLRPAPLLWEALTGAAGHRWPGGCTLDRRPVPAWGLDRWLGTPAARAATVAVAAGEEVLVVVGADRPGAVAGRLAAVAAAAGRQPVVLRAPAVTDEVARQVLLRGVVDGCVPVLWSDVPAAEVLSAAGVPRPLLLALPDAGVDAWPRPVLRIATPPLGRDERLDLLQAAVPALGPFEHPIGPASLEPTELVVAATDALAAGALAREPVTAATLAEEIDTRTRAAVPAGAVLVHPAASWVDLVLPEDREAQLREAVARIDARRTVFDEWGFLPGRSGPAGLRLLFCGPPGTGKTLAAEVMATALGSDLLVVDLSRMVSKWIGETEKNLAATFDAAERGGAVLFFDEADALFGRRTEVGDARDRYANLETAYLLARLERFDGVVVLATNLRQNIDAAFSRRIEYIVAFDPPDVAARELLWRRHLPPTAPVSPSVDLPRLAARYELPGALIRNAALAAAFLAASEPDGPCPIAIRHVLHALRREYQKAGQAFPGAPVGASR